MALKFWWKKSKCGACGEKKKELKHEVRLETADGIFDINICDECARFFDASAEVLQNRGRDNEKHDRTSDDV